MKEYGAYCSNHCCKVCQKEPATESGQPAFQAAVVGSKYCALHKCGEDDCPAMRIGRIFPFCKLHTCKVKYINIALLLIHSEMPLHPLVQPPIHPLTHDLTRCTLLLMCIRWRVVWVALVEMLLLETLVRHIPCVPKCYGVVNYVAVLQSLRTCTVPFMLLACTHLVGMKQTREVRGRT